MAGLSTLREIMQLASNVSGPIFAPGRLRFVLEPLRPGKQPRAVASDLQPRIAALTGSNLFDLEPLFDEAEPNGTVFLVLAIRGVERTLPQDELYAIAADMRQALDLISCEPDIGANVFVDPEVALPLGVESAVVDSYCWAEGPAPADMHWALAKTGVIDAWTSSPGRGAGIVIAQPDTGITQHLEVLDATLDLTKSLNVLEGGTSPNDPLRAGTANPGHGTGTLSVAASGENGPISGSAPRATMVPIRCIEDVKIFDGSPVAKAVDHAVQVGAHVITMSLGGIWSRSLRQAVKKAVSRDIIVLAAAGNCTGPLVVWPAAFDEVIAVGGTNIRDEMWQGSSHGSKVDFSAPAEFVWRAERKTSTDPIGLVSGGQGTSFAVALSAGIAALWLSHFGRDKVMAEARRRSTTIQELFRAAARQKARRPVNWSAGLGTGVINAEALLSLPLNRIEMPAAAMSAAGGLESALDTVIGQGAFDTRFDLAAHGAELSAIMLADAKAGRSAAEGAFEARSFHKASQALAEAAALASDSRLAHLALRKSLTAPSLIVQPDADPARMARIIKSLGRVTQAGISPEAAEAIPVEEMQRRLDGEGRKGIIEPLMRRVEQAGQHSLLNDVNAVDRSIDRLHRAGIVAQLNEADTLRLEALVSLTDRPALPVTVRTLPDGSSIQTIDVNDPALGSFAGLVAMTQADFETSILSSIGRIDAGGLHIGTGTVVGTVAGPKLIMTNRHVAESLASPLPTQDNPSRWIISAPATIDFSPAADDPNSRFAISAIAYAGPQQILGYPVDFKKLDIALLVVEATNAQGKALPPAIPVSRDGTLAVGHAQLCTIGYPAPPSVLPRDEIGMIRRDVVDRLREIFGLRFHRKYFSPGVIQGAPNNWVFDHDATTLGGNSGSPVVYLGDHLPLIGLHFAGDWLRANHAHKLAEVIAANTTVAAFIDGMPAENSSRSKGKDTRKMKKTERVGGDRSRRKSSS